MTCDCIIQVFDFNGADTRKDFLIWMFFVIIFFVLPAGYAFTNTHEGAHSATAPPFKL